MAYIIFDLVIGAILLAFALRGQKRGLILTLCSLVAVIIAFVGATFVADALTPKAADLMVPKITSIIERRLEGVLRESNTAEGSQISGEITDGSTNAFTENSNPTIETVTTTDSATSGSTAFARASISEQGLTALKEITGNWTLPAGVLASAKEALSNLEDIADLPSVLSAAIARSTAETVLYLLIFIISFILILLLWQIISHALNLVSHLPVLHFFNRTGGFVLGLCKGVLFLFVVAYVLRYLGNVIPAAALEHTYLLRFFMTTDPLTLIGGSFFSP